MSVEYGSPTSPYMGCPGRLELHILARLNKVHPVLLYPNERRGLPSFLPPEARDIAGKKPHHRHLPGHQQAADFGPLNHSPEVTGATANSSTQLFIAQLRGGWSKRRALRRSVHLFNPPEMPCVRHAPCVRPQTRGLFQNPPVLLRRQHRDRKTSGNAHRVRWPRSCTPQATPWKRRQQRRPLGLRCKLARVMCS